jgi:Zn finger protein HypA/HybF involved in hydrogenase expression
MTARPGMTYNPAGRYAYRGSVQRIAQIPPTIVVRCDACGNLFEDALGEMHPCPHCHRIARGAA